MQQIIPPPHPWRSMRKSGSPLSELEQRSIQYPIPRRGEQKLLVLLVDFPDPDRSGLFTQQFWAEGKLIRTKSKACTDKREK